MLEVSPPTDSYAGCFVPQVILQDSIRGSILGASMDSITPDEVVRAPGSACGTNTGAMRQKLTGEASYDDQPQLRQVYPPDQTLMQSDKCPIPVIETARKSLARLDVDYHHERKIRRLGDRYTLVSIGRVSHGT